jgi:ribosome-binding factor A
MNRRIAKVNEAIRESVSTTVLFDLKDPRVKNVTVLRAEVSGDLHYAKVYVSVRGDEKEKTLCLHGLQAAAGFIQHKLADRMRTRYTPQLTFVLDRGVELAAQASAILNEVLPKPAVDADVEGAEADEDLNDIEVPENNHADEYDALEDRPSRSVSPPD